MIQDIYPHRFFNQFRPGMTAETSDRILHFSEKDETLLCRMEEGALILPTLQEVSPAGTPVFLFTMDDRPYYLCRSVGAYNEDEYQFLSIREIRKALQGSNHMVFAAITAQHLFRWYRDNTFCGRCGEKTEQSDKERSLVCPVCGHIIYPRINPAVIVGVRDGERLLMTKYAGRNIPFYALIAGFAEIGETLEETVRREVMEEVGLHVKNITYYKSQPWGVADDILSGFFCDVDGSNQIRLDRSELKIGEWVERTEIEGQPDDFSLTNEMMMVFKAGKDRETPSESPAEWVKDILSGKKAGWE